MQELEKNNWKIEALKTLEYFSVSGAKSLGKEWIYGKFIPEIMKGQNNSIEDLLATTLEFASEMISKIVIENYNCLGTFHRLSLII